MKTSNPLRYPGGKSKLFNYVSNLIRTEGLEGCTFYEPFAGSASLSLLLLKSSIISKAYINEKDPLLYCFWTSVFNNTQNLNNMILETEINLENWHYYKQFRDHQFTVGKSVLEIGFACLFLNRTNFSGILKANPLGGIRQSSKDKIDCRFNKVKIIEIINEIASYRSQVIVTNYDAIEFMKRRIKYRKNNKYFVYIDPPYFKAGKSLYRYYYDQEDHEKLSSYIKTKAFPWLLSYDDHPEIRLLYETNTFTDLYLDYSVKSSRKGKEILISNLEIPPLENYSDKLTKTCC